jgi:Translation initiation factor eIF3 subunit 135/Leucine Rich repeat
MFPPAAYSKASYRQGQHLSSVLRPEWVLRGSLPLSSDAFSSFQSADDASANDAEVRMATARLVDDVVPTFANRFMRRFEDWLKSRQAFGTILTTAMHRVGLNLKYLGLVRRKCLESECVDGSQLLLIEIVARVIKQLLRKRLRDAMMASDSLVDYDQRAVVIDCLRVVISRAPESRDFWCARSELKMECCARFESALTDKELGAAYDLRASLPPIVSVVLRVQQVTGIELSPESMHELRAAPDAFDYTLADFVQFVAKVKQRPLAAHAHARVLHSESLKRSGSSSGDRLLKYAMHKFEEALERSPGSRVHRLAYGRALLRSAALLADNRERCQLLRTAISHFREARDSASLVAIADQLQEWLNRVFENSLAEFVYTAASDGYQYAAQLDATNRGALLRWASLCHLRFTQTHRFSLLEASGQLYRQALAIKQRRQRRLSTLASQSQLSSTSLSVQVESAKEMASDKAAVDDKHDDNADILFPQWLLDLFAKHSTTSSSRREKKQAAKEEGGDNVTLRLRRKLSDLPSKSDSRVARDDERDGAASSSSSRAQKQQKQRKQQKDEPSARQMESDRIFERNLLLSAKLHSHSESDVRRAVRAGNASLLPRSALGSSAGASLGASLGGGGGGDDEHHRLLTLVALIEVFKRSPSAERVDCIESMHYLPTSALRLLVDHHASLRTLRLDCGLTHRASDMDRASLDYVVHRSPLLANVAVRNAVNLLDVSALAELGATLIELDLSGCFNAGDASVAAVLRRCERLEVLRLAGARGVGNQTARAVVAGGSSRTLRVLDLNGCRRVSAKWLGRLFAKCGALETLDLSDTMLSDRALKEMMACGGVVGSQMRSLALNRCYGVGSQTLRRLIAHTREHVANGAPNTWLTSLDLSYAKVSDSVLAEIAARMRALRSLDVSHVKSLSSTTLAAFARGNGELRRLDIRGCPLVGRNVLPLLAEHCRHLETLCVDGTAKPAARVPTTLSVSPIAALRNLAVLQLPLCDLIEDAAVTLCARTSPMLRVLNLDRCALITDDALAAVAEHSRRLEVLSLRQLKLISSDGIERVARRCPLRKLVLSGVAAVSDSTLLTLAEHCPLQLQRLDIEHCEHVSDRAVRAIGERCLFLRKLTLAGCRLVSDAGVQYLRNTTSLSALSLSGLYRVTDKSVAAVIRNLPLLRSLDLSASGITDASLQLIAQFCNERHVGPHFLSTLDLRRCALSDVGVFALCSILSQGTRARAITPRAAPDAIDWLNAHDERGTGTLVGVSLFGGAITKRGIEALVHRNHASLERLCISKIESVDDGTLKVIGSQLPLLRELVARRCPSIVDGLTSVAMKCASLRVLDVSESVHVSGRSLSAIARGCIELSHLAITGCAAVDQASVLDVVRCCRRLHTLEIGGPLCQHLSTSGLREFLMLDESLQSSALTGRSRLTRSGFFTADSSTLSSVLAKAKVAKDQDDDEHCCVDKAEDDDEEEDDEEEDDEEENDDDVEECDIVDAQRRRRRRKSLTSSMRVSIPAVPSLRSPATMAFDDAVLSPHRAPSSFAAELSSVASRLHRTFKSGATGGEPTPRTGRMAAPGKRNFSRALRVLSLEQCESVSSSALVSIIERCPHLVHLSINFGNVGDTVLRSIAANCRALRFLSLSGSAELSSDALRHVLRKCRLLSYLDLALAKDLQPDFPDLMEQQFAHIHFIYSSHLQI